METIRTIAKTALLLVPGVLMWWNDVSAPVRREKRRLTNSYRKNSSDDDGQTRFSNFKFYDSDILGKGSSSFVFKGTLFDGKKIAIKRIQRPEASIMMEEYKILSEISHPNIVKNLDIEIDKYFVYIVLEFCEMSLDKMVTDGMISDINKKVKLLHGVASGLNHLHSYGIIHRDLKPSNILMKGMIPKIADFGISRKMAEGRDHYTVTDGGLGTRIWCPPEVSDDSRHITPANDLYAYGCIVHFVMCPASSLQSRHPFGALEGDIGSDGIISSMKAGKRQIYLSTIPCSNKNAIDVVKSIFADILVQDLTHAHPENRPAINHVLNFPLFWDMYKQNFFFTDVFTHMNKYHEKFEKNCVRFFSHKTLTRLFTAPDSWETISEQLRVAGLPTVPKTIPSDELYTNILRILRNNITHYSEKGSNARIPIDSMLTKFHQQFPFFPILWVTYRYLQIPSRYPPQLNMVKAKLEAYYTPIDVGDPYCLVTNLDFIKE